MSRLFVIIGIQGDVGGGTAVISRVVIGAIIGKRTAEKPIEGGVTGGGNGEAAGRVSTAGHRVDPVDHADGHRESRPVGAMEPFACFEAKKIVSPLAVPRGTQGDGADRSRVHAVVVDLVGLGVFSKFESGMEPVVDSFSRDDGTGADTLGDPERMGERVEPKNSHEDHFDDHPRGERVEREDIVGTAGPFLDGPYAPFDRGDMFILTTDVQVRVETVSDISAEALEFAVAVDRV